jgi:hypothetical protein
MGNRQVIAKGIIACGLILSLFFGSYSLRKETPKPEAPLIVSKNDAAMYLKINEWKGNSKLDSFYK